MSESLEIVVVRHGESKANTEARLQGRFDSPLTDRGRRQAHAVGAWLARHEYRWDEAVSSPLSRARETAEIIADEGRAPPPALAPELAEVAAGSLEGLTLTEIGERYPSYSARRVDELGDFSEYGGESYADIQRRVAAVTARLFALPVPRRVLVVAHGGFNFHLVKHLICLPVPRVCVLRMDNCCATLVRVRPRRGTRLGEVAWHVPVELMEPGIGARPAPAPGTAAT